MSIGEKIKICRKQCNMSQEELGQQLMVSRQTISLWETGQALPTIDNLIRLKEIFKMPIDSIICDEPEDALKPRESYSFPITPFDLENIQKVLFKRQNSHVGHFLLASVLLFIPVMFADNVGFATGILFAFILMFSAALLRSSKERKMTASEYYKRSDSIFNYRVYSDYMICDVVRDGETVQTTKLYYHKIDKIYYIGEYVAVSYRNILYLLKKSEISENSKIYTLLPRDTSLSPEAFAARRYTSISIYLILLSIASILGGLWITAIISDGKAFIDYTWIFYLFTPIPLSLIGYGIYLIKKKHAGILSIIIGVIVCLMLVLYGSFCFLI